MSREINPARWKQQVPASGVFLAIMAGGTSLSLLQPLFPGAGRLRPRDRRHGPVAPDLAFFAGADEELLDARVAACPVRLLYRLSADGFGISSVRRGKRGGGRGCGCSADAQAAS